MYGRQGKCIQGFDGETWVKESTEDRGLVGRIILKLFFKNRDRVTWT